MSHESYSKANLSKALPELVAEEILAEYAINGGHTFIYWRGSPYSWDGYVWQKISQGDFDAWVNRVLRQQYKNLRRHAVEEVMHNIITTIKLNDAIEPPSIIAPDSLTGKPAAGWDWDQAIFGLDGILYLPWLKAQIPGCFIPSTPSVFSASHVNCSVQLWRERPVPLRWLAFLDSIFAGDTESIRALQKCFGRFLTAPQNQQETLMVVAPPQSGIGTIAKVLHAIQQDCTVCLFSRDTMTLAEQLLSASVYDSLPIDRSYNEQVDGKLPSRVVMLSNELPTDCDAAASRMIVLPIHKSFCQQEDLNLFDELRSELDAIFWWAIDGWLEQQPLQEFPLGDSNPISAFVHACCEVDAECSVPKTELFEAYEEWCFQNGQCNPHFKEFFRSLDDFVPDLVTTRPRQGSKQVWTVSGIQLTPA